MNSEDKKNIENAYIIKWHKEDIKNNKVFQKGLVLVISKNFSNQKEKALDVLANCVKNDKTLTPSKKQKQIEGIQDVKTNFNTLLKEAKEVEKKFMINKIAGNKHLSDCKNIEHTR